MRSVISFLRKREKLVRDLPDLSSRERNFLLEMATTKKYTPRSYTGIFSTYNFKYRDWIFAEPSFCRIFMIYYGMHSNLKNKIGTMKESIISRAVNLYGIAMRKDFEKFLADLKRLALKTLIFKTN